MYERPAPTACGAEVLAAAHASAPMFSSAGYYDAYYLRAQKGPDPDQKDSGLLRQGVHAILTAGDADRPLRRRREGTPIECISTTSSRCREQAGLPASPFRRQGCAGLAAGLQLIGRPFDEETLFRSARSERRFTPASGGEHAISGRACGAAPRAILRRHWRRGWGANGRSGTRAPLCGRSTRDAAGFTPICIASRRFGNAVLVSAGGQPVRGARTEMERMRPPVLEVEEHDGN